MVQRNLGARTIYDAKFGYVMAAIPKTLGAFLYVVPMVIAPIIFAQKGIFVERADASYGKLILNLLPSGMLGLFIAGLLSAGLSSISSVLNSTSTMLIKDFYERFLVKKCSDHHYFIAGRIATFAIIAVSLLLVPVVLQAPLIMWLEQTLLAMVLGPFMGVLMLAIFWRRANTVGSLVGFVTGGIFAILLQQVFGVNIFFQISWWSFVVTTIVTIAVTLFTSRPKPEQVDGLTWESDFKAKLGEVLQERAGCAPAVGPMSRPGLRRPPWYLNIKYWATAILLSQIVLLFFFG
jgi:SSS family solute:Na+ symporter